MTPARSRSVTVGRVPEISRFLGIVIWVYYVEHGVLRFHAVYGRHRIAVGAGGSRLASSELEGRRVAVGCAGSGHGASGNWATTMYGSGPTSGGVTDGRGDRRPNVLLAVAVLRV